MFFEQFAFLEASTDIPIPVTNRERVGRTIEVRSIEETEMINTGTNEGSAKIYQFPAGGRSALAGRRYGEAKLDAATAAVNVADCSGSWYHAEAIQEANLGRDKLGRDH